jgi:hypothetical protein
MTSVQLATMSTALWVVATVALFILLAHWSTGESWGLSASIVRGVRGWAEHDHRTPPTVSSPFVEPPAPLLVPSRPIGGAAAARLPSAPLAVDPASMVEVVDLGEHGLPPR